MCMTSESKKKSFGSVNWRVLIISSRRTKKKYRRQEEKNITLRSWKTRNTRLKNLGIKKFSSKQQITQVKSDKLKKKLCKVKWRNKHPMKHWNGLNIKENVCFGRKQKQFQRKI